MISGKFILAGLSLFIAGGQAAAQATGPSVLPPGIAAHVPRNLRPYFLAFLVDPAERLAMPEDLFLRHQAYIRRQLEAGIYHLAGPLTDHDRIRGIIILSAASIEEARALVAADPSVQEGVLAVEVHPVLLPSLASLRIEFPPPD